MVGWVECLQIQTNWLPFIPSNFRFVYLNLSIHTFFASIANFYLSAPFIFLISFTLSSSSSSLPLPHRLKINAQKLTFLCNRASQGPIRNSHGLCRNHPEVHGLRQDCLFGRQAHSWQSCLPQSLLPLPPLQRNPQGNQISCQTPLDSLLLLPNGQMRLFFFWGLCLIRLWSVHEVNWSGFVWISRNGVSDLWPCVLEISLILMGYGWIWSKRFTNYRSDLQLSNYNSFEGVLYCRPHFDQLFKRTGSLDKSFEGTSKKKKLSCKWSLISIILISSNQHSLYLDFRHAKDWKTRETGWFWGIWLITLFRLFNSKFPVL